MLYLDAPQSIVPVDPYSNKRCIVLGRRFHQRGPSAILHIPTSLYSQTQLRAGLHVDLTINGDNRKTPTILADIEDEKKLFLILSSRLTSAQDHFGNIRIPRSQKPHIITRAFAPEGTGLWETLVLKAKKGDSFYVNWNRKNGSDASNCFYYVASLDQVYAYPQEFIPGLFAELDVTPPFTVRDDPDPLVSRIDRREWQKL